MPVLLNRQFLCVFNVGGLGSDGFPRPPPAHRRVQVGMAGLHSATGKSICHGVFQRISPSPDLSASAADCSAGP